MITGRSRFNTYLFLGLAALVCGCQTPAEKKKDKAEEEEKPGATLQVHLEVRPNSMDFSQKVEIFRAMPVELDVDKLPFLTEALVSEVKVIEEGGSFALQVQFDRRGTWLLENYTTANPGKHFAIYSKFGPNLSSGRWLAAPIISRRISNGMLTFAPDASRAEVDEIVLGLNAVAKEVQAKSHWR